MRACNDQRGQETRCVYFEIKPRRCVKFARHSLGSYYILLPQQLCTAAQHAFHIARACVPGLTVVCHCGRRSTTCTQRNVQPGPTVQCEYTYSNCNTLTTMDCSLSCCTTPTNTTPHSHSHFCQHELSDFWCCSGKRVFVNITCSVTMLCLLGVIRLFRRQRTFGFFSLTPWQQANMALYQVHQKGTGTRYKHLVPEKLLKPGGNWWNWSRDENAFRELF